MGSDRYIDRKMNRQTEKERHRQSMTNAVVMFRKFWCESQLSTNAI